jgi:glycosyltransferase involved in cell wall biosynthesis
MAITAAEVEEEGARVLPRALAGATVLQIITALRDNTEARTAVSIARALVHAGARAIVAAGAGPLVDELKSFGGEWLPFASMTMNPFRLRRNADRLEPILAEQRVDIVHAKNAGAAWSALVATDRSIVRLVTDLPDLPHQRMRLAAFYLGGLSRGDRIIARSHFNAQPMLRRYRIPQDRLSVIPRSIDIARFNPTAIDPERVAALRQSWGIPSRVRIVLAPGRVSPGNGQMSLVAAARMLVHNGMTGVTFVIAGDDRHHRRHARSIMKRARAENVDALFRIVGHVPDMPTAYAAADFVVVPCTVPPIYGQIVAEAQAMARPVIASAIGPIPENLVVPPRMPTELRTGWLVQPGDSIEIARALATALSLNATEYRALAARARQFAEYMFAPSRVAAATLEVYSSLLESEP